MNAPLAGFIAVTFFLAASSARSQTLNWASFTNSTIVDSDGDALDNTFVFQLGAFDPAFTPNVSNAGEWFTNWRVFDTADYSYNPTDLGHFSGTASIQDVPAYAAMFEGLKAYLWIRNASHTEYFLASAITWTFPVAQEGCCPTGVTTWSVSDFGTGVPVWGSQDGHDGGGTFTPGPYEIQTHTVPEASWSLLVLLGGGAVLLRRRRGHR